MLYEAEYSRGMNKSSLILTAAEKNYVMDIDSVEMFRYNEIPCFLKMQVQRKDTCEQFSYDITGRRSLEQLLEYKELDYAMLCRILNSFDQACIQTEDYLLSENDILLQPEFIFYDHESEQMLHCYLPGNESDICRQFQGFMDYLLQHLEHKDKQAVQLAYGVHQRVTEEKESLHAVLAEFRKGSCVLQTDRPSNTGRKKEQEQDLPVMDYSKDQKAKGNDCVMEDRMESLEPQHKEFIRKESVPEPKIRQAETARKQDRTQLYAESGKTPKIQQRETAKKQAAERLKNLLRKKIYTDASCYLEEEDLFQMDAEEEPIVSNPTVCLMPETEGIQNQFVYQGMDRSRDFRCSEGKMILGSSTKESDICIPLPMVSRVHARIVVNAEGTFLEDLNSTNGTQVNGKLLNYKEKKMLQKGDIISLAGECYSFH